MRPERAALILLAAAIPACGSGASADPMTVTEVIRSIDRLNGRTVRVVGYLMECGGYECRLYGSRTDKEQGDRFIDALMRNAHEGRRREPAGDMPSALGIGPGDDRRFDAMAAPFANSYVVLTGRVTNQCRHYGEPACLDRSTDFEPISIARWHPPAAGSPAAPSQ